VHASIDVAIHVREVIGGLGYTLKRYASTFGIDEREVHELASPGYPPAFLFRY
jgi:hypothetical protein